MTIMNRSVDSGGARFAPHLLSAAYRISRIFGRGYGVLNRMIFKMLPGERDAVCTMRLEDGSEFSFLCSDKYWNQMFSKDYVYEPDLDKFFYRIRDLDFDFLDIGANFGYWSVLLSSRYLGSKKVVSVELDGSNFRTLEKHAKMNGQRFSVLHAGIYDEDNVKVTVSSGHHSTRHIVESATGSSNGEEEVVKTIRIDSLVARYGINNRPILIKLDVEGAEERAISGIGDLDVENIALVLEEHGKDRSHSITRRLLGDDRFDCYFMSDSGGLSKIENVNIVSGLKKNHFRGYNILALPKASGRSSLPSEIRGLFGV